MVCDAGDGSSRLSACAMLITRAVTTNTTTPQTPARRPPVVATTTPTPPPNVRCRDATYDQYRKLYLTISSISRHRNTTTHPPQPSTLLAMIVLMSERNEVRWCGPPETHRVSRLNCHHDPPEKRRVSHGIVTPRLRLRPLETQQVTYVEHLRTTTLLCGARKHNGSHAMLTLESAVPAMPAPMCNTQYTLLHL